jgi:hypothetical protein
MKHTFQQLLSFLSAAVWSSWRAKYMFFLFMEEGMMILPPVESLNLEPSSSSRHDFRMDDDSGLHRRKKQREKTKPE